jgi:hypothetical protein
MILDQSFSSPRPREEVLDLAVDLLTRSDFRLRSRQDDRVEFVRGRGRPISRRVDELPQEIVVEVEHGVVKIVATVIPRGGRDRQQHIDLVMPVITELQKLIEGQTDVQTASRVIRDTHANSGVIWSLGEIACFFFLGVFLAVVITAIVWYYRS